jgi:hypothetical protein
LFAEQIQLRSSVEFHDSTVSAITREGTSIRISVDAYVHRWDRVDGTWKGTGWIQPILIALVNASNETPLECPATLAGGEILAGQVTYENLVPLPFDSSGPATLQLELLTGKMLAFTGGNLVIEPMGGGPLR